MLAVFQVCAIYFCVNFALGQFDDNENKNKRLLLNDPDVAATKIANLEAAVQTLKGTVSKLVDSLQEVKKIQGMLTHMYTKKILISRKEMVI